MSGRQKSQSITIFELIVCFFSRYFFDFTPNKTELHYTFSDQKTITVAIKKTQNWIVIFFIMYIDRSWCFAHCCCIVQMFKRKQRKSDNQSQTHYTHTMRCDVMRFYNAQSERKNKGEKYWTVRCDDCFNTDSLLCDWMLWTERLCMCTAKHTRCVCCTHTASYKLFEWTSVFDSVVRSASDFRCCLNTHFMRLWVVLLYKWLYQNERMKKVITHRRQIKNKLSDGKREYKKIENRKLP